MITSSLGIKMYAVGLKHLQNCKCCQVCVVFPEWMWLRVGVNWHWFSTPSCVVLAWGSGDGKLYVYEAQCHCAKVSFSPNIHNKQGCPKCEPQVWFLLCLSPCSTLCPTMLHLIDILPQFLQLFMQYDIRPQYKGTPLCLFSVHCMMKFFIFSCGKQL